MIGKGEGIAIQLDRYVATGRLLSAAVADRLRNAPKSVAVNWRALVNEKFGPMNKPDTDEERARTEKATALEHLSNSRVGVLIGPAGTGKTTVIQLLLARTDIVGARVRLLAPTGKARVRLGQEKPDNRATFRPWRNSYSAPVSMHTKADDYTNAEAPKVEATTCIVDESSMLTEDMLAAIIDALPANCRVILVGDPYQLPPIGAGCPFVDIIEHLKRAHQGKGVAELNTPRRQDDASDSNIKNPMPVLSRSDVQLAAIFSGRELPPGEDEIVVSAIEGKDDETVKYRRWENTADLPDLIESALTEEFGCDKGDLVSKLQDFSA